MQAVSAQLMGFGAISRAGNAPHRKTPEWRMLEVLDPGPGREEGSSWDGAARWGCQGVRAEPAVLSGVFMPNLLTLPSCCKDVFMHWECGGKRGMFGASKVDKQTKNSADQGILSKMAITVCDKSYILVSEVECSHFCLSSAVGQSLCRVL